MYVSGARMKTGEEPIANATIVAEEMHTWLRQIDGFEGMIVLSRPGSSIGLTFWVSREVAEKHRPARMEFLDRIASVAGIEVEEILDHDIMFAALGALQT